MAWTTPRDWQTGLEVSSAIANQQWRDNQMHLYARAPYIFTHNPTTTSGGESRLEPIRLRRVKADGTELVTGDSNYSVGYSPMAFLRIAYPKPMNTFMLNLYGVRVTPNVATWGDKFGAGIQFAYRVTASSVGFPITNTSTPTSGWNLIGDRMYFWINTDVGNMGVDDGNTANGTHNFSIPFQTATPPGDSILWVAWWGWTLRWSFRNDGGFIQNASSFSQAFRDRVNYPGYPTCHVVGLGGTDLPFYGDGSLGEKNP